jgi:hypothetical protein
MQLAEIAGHTVARSDAATVPASSAPSSSNGIENRSSPNESLSATMS